MKAVTIRIPPRKKGNDAIVALYRGLSAARPGKPAATTSIPAATLDGLVSPDGIRAFFLDQKGESDRFVSDGRTLFAAMFSSELAEEWRKLTQAAQGDDVRVYLSIEDADLALLPWEMMIDDTGPLFLRPNPIVLRWRDPSSRPKLTDPWPIRVLVVVGCDENQADLIGADRELRAIRRCLRAVDHSFDLEVLDARYATCNQAEFRSSLDRLNPHILHFIGHATSDKNGASLTLWDREAKVWGSWPASDLSIALQQNLEQKTKRDLRIVFLNACRTQVKEEQVAAPSLAEAFLRVGVPAVIAMQADVHGDAANVSAAQFYEHLAAGDSIDVAVETGRARILDRPDLGTKTRNPFCAVLIVQREPETILRYRHKVIDAAQRDQIEECTTLKPVRSMFVNRTTLRRNLIETFFHAPEGKERSAAVLRGTQDAGKSWLAKWLLGVYAFRNYRVRYVEARHYANWLELMRAVLSQKKSGDYVHQPLPQRAQDYFYWTLNHVALGQPVPLGDPPEKVQDGQQSLTNAILKDNDAVSRIMLAFYEALKIAAGETGLLLVADHWHKAGDYGAAPVTVADLKANLWDRIAEQHASPVKLLLILPPAVPGNPASDPEYPTAHWKHVDVGEIPGIEAPVLLEELYGLRFKDTEPSKAELGTFSLVNAPSFPKDLDAWVMQVRKLIGAGRD